MVDNLGFFLQPFNQVFHNIDPNTQVELFDSFDRAKHTGSLIFYYDGCDTPFYMNYDKVSENYDTLIDEGVYDSSYTLQQYVIDEICKFVMYQITSGDDQISAYIDDCWTNMDDCWWLDND